MRLAPIYMPLLPQLLSPRYPSRRARAHAPPHFCAPTPVRRGRMRKALLDTAAPERARRGHSQGSERLRGARVSITLPIVVSHSFVYDIVILYKNRYTALHQCEVCPAAFAKHHQLRAHTAAEHAPPGSKPYLCTHGGCTKSFATAQKLRAHAKVHDGQSSPRHPPSRAPNKN